MPRILLIDDDEHLGPPLAQYFQRFGLVLEQAYTPSQGLARLQQGGFGAAILDVMLPEMDGFELCRSIRRTSAIPLIMLTARGEEEDKVRGLEVGADDYITKPFSPKELTARLKAVIRRAVPTATEEVIEVQGLKLDPVSHRVTVNEQALDLGPTEFRLLHFFMTHPERVYSREQLLNNVWGTNVYVEDRTVDVHIRRLRKAIEETGHDRLIQTVRGAGYRFSTRL